MSRRIAIVLVLAALEFAQVVRAQIATGPSSHCHVTDGTFTTCPDGSAEWSDVQSTSFPATNSYLYVNQDAARTALFLMYDLPLRTTPLASNESVLVSFDTVEDQPTGAALEHYDISIFGDSHIQVLVFGQPEAAGNIVGAVGFHPSPNSPLPHVVAELQVPLVPGGATVYSPDPNFWSSTIPPTPPPDPCPTEPGKTLNKCEKQLDRAVGLGSGVLALGVGAFVGVCTFFTGGLCLPSVALAFGFGATSLVLSDKVNDPSDPNFTIIAQPEVHTLSIQPLTTAQGLTQQEADALNELFTNMEQAIAFDQAALTAINRAQGARDAGSAFWVTKQTQAAQSFGAQAGTFYTAQPALLANLVAALKAAGVQLTFTANDIRTFQSGLRLNGIPPAARQALTDLGFGDDDQARILQLLLSADPEAAATLGNGVFPQLLSDPEIVTALQQAGAAAIQAAPSAESLSPSFNVTVAGDYVAAGVGLRDTTQGAITISGIPAGATILKAFLYWGMLDDGEDPSLGQLSFNGNPVTGSLVGIGPDTCWARTNSFTYRAVVTPFVSGNGTYDLTGVANGGNILAEGASLVVLYQNPAAPLKTVILEDGDVVFPAVSSGTTEVTGFTASGPVSATTTFMVGDGQGFGNPASFTGSAGTASFTNPFVGSDGPLWDTLTFDVSPEIGSGSGSGSATITLTGDCLMWVAQAFSVTTSTAPTPVTTTAAVVQASQSLDTTVNVRGLTPQDEPTLQDKIEAIVQSRVIKNSSTSAADLTTQLVNSLPSSVLPPDQASNLVNAVLQQVVVPADTTPPITTATPLPGPNSHGWNNTNVTVTLSPTDNQGGSGVKQINISLSGAQTGTSIVSGNSASVTINSEGITAIAYFATDNAGNQETIKTLTVRIDKTPPSVTVAATPASLWPPNGQMFPAIRVPVTISGTTTDDTSGVNTTSVTFAVTDEYGTVHPSGPVTLAASGNYSFKISLQASRRGTDLDGRLYTITVSAQDNAGNQGSSSTTVIVPHDQGK